MSPTCQSCRHFDDDPASLESQLPGIRALGSAYGSSMGRAGICRVTDRLMDPIPAESCPHFEPRLAAISPTASGELD